MLTNNSLFDASSTIHEQIKSLQRGMPIAISKASSLAAKARVRQRYNAEIAALTAQYRAVYAAFEATVPAMTTDETY